MTFKLEIELGNDAVRTFSQIAKALAGVAKRLRDNNTRFIAGDTMKIMDDNGNTVGQWGCE